MITVCFVLATLIAHARVCLQWHKLTWLTRLYSDVDVDRHVGGRGSVAGVGGKMEKIYSLRAVALGGVGQLPALAANYVFLAISEIMLCFRSIFWLGITS